MTQTRAEPFREQRIDILQMFDMIQTVGKTSDGKPPKILLISPTHIDESIPETYAKYKGAGEKMKQLGTEYKKIAEANECDFVDLALHVSPSKKDGLHLDPEAHEAIAKLLEERLRMDQRDQPVPSQ